MRGDDRGGRLGDAHAQGCSEARGRRRAAALHSALGSRCRRTGREHTDVNGGRGDEPARASRFGLRWWRCLSEGSGAASSSGTRAGRTRFAELKQSIFCSSRLDKSFFDLLCALFIPGRKLGESRPVAGATRPYSSTPAAAVAMANRLAIALLAAEVLPGTASSSAAAGSSSASSTGAGTVVAELSE